MCRIEEIGATQQYLRSKLKISKDGLKPSEVDIDMDRERERDRGRNQAKNKEERNVEAGREQTRFKPPGVETRSASIERQASIETPTPPLAVIKVKKEALETPTLERMSPQRRYSDRVNEVGSGSVSERGSLGRDRIKDDRNMEGGRDKERRYRDRAKEDESSSVGIGRNEKSEDDRKRDKERDEGRTDATCCRAAACGACGAGWCQGKSFNKQRIKDIKEQESGTGAGRVSSRQPDGSEDRKRVDSERLTTRQGGEAFGHRDDARDASREGVVEKEDGKGRVGERGSERDNKRDREMHGERHAERGRDIARVRNKEERNMEGGREGERRYSDRAKDGSGSATERGSERDREMLRERDRDRARDLDRERGRDLDRDRNTEERNMGGGRERERRYSDRSKEDGRGSASERGSKRERERERGSEGERRYSERSKEGGGRSVSERDSLARDRNKEEKNMEGGRERGGIGGGKGGSGYSERDKGKERSPCWC